VGNRTAYPPQGERALSDLVPQTRPTYEKHNKQSAPLGRMANSAHEIKGKKGKKGKKVFLRPLLTLFYFITACDY
jgi:hypothetical protein